MIRHIIIEDRRLAVHEETIEIWSWWDLAMAALRAFWHILLPRGKAITKEAAR